jgi:DNA modification methylase
MTHRDQIFICDAFEGLSKIPDGVVQCCVTSPPYYGLRDYGTRTWFGGSLSCPHNLDMEHGPHHPNQVEQTKWPLAEAAGKGQTAITHSCTECGAWYGQLGLEPTPEMYVEHLVSIFREVRRVLRDNGVVFLNLGDSYVTTPTGNRGTKSVLHGANSLIYGSTLDRYVEAKTKRAVPVGLKMKDLIGIPWMAAFALRSDGWILRQAIIWNKENAMPESISGWRWERCRALLESGQECPGCSKCESNDGYVLRKGSGRCTSAHEYIFLLAKSSEYFYDQEAIKESAVSDHPSGNGFIRNSRLSYLNENNTPRGNTESWTQVGGQRNKRSVWSINTKPYKGSHFAVMPEELASICIKAGSSEKGCSKCSAPCVRVLDSGKTIGWKPSCSCGVQTTLPCLILDPFAGSGTTLSVAAQLGRSYVGIELNPEYEKLIKERLNPAVEDRNQREIFEIAMGLSEDTKEM